MTATIPQFRNDVFSIPRDLHPREFFARSYSRATLGSSLIRSSFQHLQVQRRISLGNKTIREQLDYSASLAPPDPLLFPQASMTGETNGGPAQPRLTSSICPGGRSRTSISLLNILMFTIQWWMKISTAPESTLAAVTISLLARFVF